MTVLFPNQAERDEFLLLVCDSFGINPASETGVRLQNARTLGGISDILSDCKDTHGSPQTGLSAHVFYRLKQAYPDSADRQSLTPATQLSDILSQHRHNRFLNSFALQTGMKVPYSRPGGRIIIPVLSGLLSVGLVFTPGLAGLGVAGLLASIGLFLLIIRFYPGYPGGRDATLADLTGDIAARNETMLSRELKNWRNSEIGDSLRHLLAEASDNPPADLSRDTHLMAG